MMLLSYTIVYFHLFYDGAVYIQIWAPLTRSQCKVSDTQVTLKACGPLVNNTSALKKMLDLLENGVDNCNKTGLLLERFHESTSEPLLVCVYIQLQSK